MNYEKLTDGLNKEEIQAIYENWNRRTSALIEAHFIIFVGWLDSKALDLAHELLERLEFLSLNYLNEG